MQHLRSAVKQSAMKGGLPVLVRGVTGGPGGKRGRGHGGVCVCGPCGLKAGLGLLGETPSLWPRPPPWAPF